MDTKILLSIKPKYSRAIFQGKKNYEFRKSIFRQKVKTVYVYSSLPDGKVIGLFDIGEVIEGSPVEIWNKVGNQGAISKKDFFDYFGDSPRAYAIEIINPIEYKPHKIISMSQVPQSFRYLLDINKISKTIL